MNFYEKEMRTMFGDTDIITDANFCGKTMLGRLDDELISRENIIRVSVGEKPV